MQSIADVPQRDASDLVAELRAVGAIGKPPGPPCGPGPDCRPAGCRCSSRTSCSGFDGMRARSTTGSPRSTVQNSPCPRATAPTCATLALLHRPVQLLPCAARPAGAIANLRSAPSARGKERMDRPCAGRSGGPGSPGRRRCGGDQARARTWSGPRSPFRARLFLFHEAQPEDLPRILRPYAPGPGLGLALVPAGHACLGALTLLGALLPLGVAYAGKAHRRRGGARGSRALTLRWVLVELGARRRAGAACQRGSASCARCSARGFASTSTSRSSRRRCTSSCATSRTPEFYDQLTRARREASSRPLSVVTESFQLVQNAAHARRLRRAAPALQRPWAVLGLLVAAVPATLAEMRFSSAAFRLRNWRSPESRRLNYLEYVLANDEHAKEVKLFGLGPAAPRPLPDAAARRSTTRTGARRAARRRGPTLLSLLGTGAFYALLRLHGARPRRAARSRSAT